MEKYTRLKTIPEMLYAQSSPVIIMAGALLRANETERVLAQIKFKNICPRRIQAVFIRIQAFDIAGRQVEGFEEFQYLDLSASRDEEFGSRTAVLLPDNKTRDIRVECTQVIFADGKSWKDSAVDWEPLLEQKSLKSVLNERELLKQFRIKYGSNTHYCLAEEKGIWRCTCGAVNGSSETECHICNQSLERLRSFDENLLRIEMNDLLKAEKAEKERRVLAEKIEAEKKEQAERIKKQQTARSAK